MPMTVTEFGDRLIATQDLDPVYVGVVGAGMNMDQKARWLLAYWCFYHVGSACLISEQRGSDFWRMLRIAAENEIPHPTFGRWPRSPERRHFRGQKCVDAVYSLKAMYGKPEAAVMSLCNCNTEVEVMNIVQSWPQFGPWIAFKAADMLERCAHIPIKFSPNIGLIYEEPAKALDMIVANGFDGTKEEAYRRLLFYWCSEPAPPVVLSTHMSSQRMCGPQEIETVLCKWKSHWNGHYWVGKDILECRHALKGWGETAERMLNAMPEEVAREDT